MGASKTLALVKNSFYIFSKSSFDDETFFFVVQLKDFFRCISTIKMNFGFWKLFLMSFQSFSVEELFANSVRAKITDADKIFFF